MTRKTTALIAIIAIASAVLALVVGLSVGYGRGFDACIEENNLYENY